ncbi:MAG: formylglycine-generating enzyme family protein [Planctomycetota bacterium]
MGGFKFRKRQIFLLLAAGVAAVSVNPAAGSDVLLNSIGMKMVLVPAGSFLMGSDETPEQLTKQFSGLEVKWVDGERPRHRVSISKPFFFGIHEVTRGQFSTFCERTGYQTDAEKDDKGGWGCDPRWRKQVFQKPGYSWKRCGFKQDEHHPAVNLSWNDAVAFCAWLTQREGVRYRLPTEAEWEYACRAGSETRYINGNDPEGLILVGNVRDQSVTETVPALETPSGFKRRLSLHRMTGGKLSPNPLGLFDMHGNAWEWCSDWYDADYYAKSPAVGRLAPSQERNGLARWLLVAASRHCPLGIPFVLPRGTICCDTGFRIMREHILDAKSTAEGK